MTKPTQEPNINGTIKEPSKGENTPSPHEESSKVDLGLADLGAIWQRVVSAYAEQIARGGELAEAEVKLSVKAAAICAAALILLLGLAIITWAAIGLTLGFTLYTTGMHWLAIPVAVVALNFIVGLGLFFLIKQIKPYIGLPKTLKALSKQDNKE